MQLRCPITTAHVMTETADGLYQCPDCGAGPTEFWALSSVEDDEGTIGALCATWRPDLECYVLSLVSWAVDGRGHRVPGAPMHSSLVGYASTARELADTPLPARGEDGTVLRLRGGMFSSPLGEKLVRSGGRPGRSAGEPSPGQPGGRFHSRQKRSGK